MATRGQVAAAVAKNKEAHPEKYCPVRGCLWALRSGPCRKHGRDAQVTEQVRDRLRTFLNSISPEVPR
jgi:hypothetical protein